MPGLPFDPAIPDPFDVVGFIGVIPPAPNRSWGRAQARYRFANGFGAGVLFDGPLSCDGCQTDERPYELHALHRHGEETELCERHVGHVCGVDAEGVRHWLSEIAGLSADETCDHEGEGA